MSEKIKNHKHCKICSKIMVQKVSLFISHLKTNDDIAYELTVCKECIFQTGRKCIEDAKDLKLPNSKNQIRKIDANL